MGLASSEILTESTVDAKTAVATKPTADKADSMRGYFSTALFLATVVPFFVGLSNLLHISKFHNTQSVIYYIAGIHVPMTAYLFFDPAIRKQARSRPLIFIAMPVALFALCMLFFFGDLQAIMAHEAKGVTYFLLAVLSWNMWHFGKQNIGVYSYYRLAQFQGGMAPFERKLLYAGAVLGALSVTVIGLGTYQAPYSTNSDFHQWIAIADSVKVAAKYAQYALALLTLGYMLRNAERFNAKIALIFFLSVNYFLPTYMRLNGLEWSIFYAVSTMAHGVQYMIFLLFHSWNMKPRVAIPKPRSFTRSVSIPLYTGVFIIMAITLGDMFINHKLFPAITSTYDHTPGAYWMALADTFAIWLLLTHFWLDSFFWRFKNKDAREWMTKRYDFLFKTNK